MRCIPHQLVVIYVLVGFVIHFVFDWTLYYITFNYFFDWIVFYFRQAQIMLGMVQPPKAVCFVIYEALIFRFYLTLICIY